MKKPTAKDVTVGLYFSLRGASQLLIPRFTPKGWWECDLWRLTDADFVDEYEIKMSVADFRADALKVQTGFEIDPVTRRYREKTPEAKHSLLATDQRGPNRFWYVMPVEIAAKVEIPEYAGLLVFSDYGGGSPHMKKQAPKRHGRKWEGDKLKLFSTFYHRYWTHEAGIKDDAAPMAEPIHGLDADDPKIPPQPALL